MKNIPFKPAQLTKWALAGFAALLLTACGSGSDNDAPAVAIPDDFVPVAPPEPEEPGSGGGGGGGSAEPVSFVVFEDEVNPNWIPWDCCGGTSPTTVEDEDPEHGDVTRFNIGADPAVLGFISRPSEGAAEAEPFDARSIVNNGTFSFDLKMTAAPVNGQTPWLVKIESGSGDSFVEVPISTANEGHENPELGTWQTYTFNLADLAQAGANTGLDLSNLDAIFIFPTWGEGEGAEYLVDNVKFEGEASAPPPEPFSFVVFEEEENPNWIAWDCCGGTTPTIVADDAEHGNTFQFMIGADPAVLGFISRPSEGAAEAEPVDVRDIANSGTFSFDLKMTAAPVNGQTPWLVKIESGGGDSFVEVPISTANEGHENPELDTWQTYTFNLADLAQAGANTGLDLSNIDAIFIFPTWGEGEGAEYRVDNVKFEGEGTAAPAPAPEPAGFVVFEEEENPNWVAWDCCGGTTPTIVADDAEHGNTFQFMIGADPAVLGFISRPSEGAAEAEPFDARELTNNGGTFSFDLKMTAAPVNGQTPWLVKIESGSGDSFVEVNLSTANEGHANPELDTWQTYTFNLADLAQAGANTGLDLSNLDAIFIFPTWGEGEGAEFLIDNVKFQGEGTASPAPAPEPAGFVVFEEQENPNWIAWDCCGGTTPIIVADNAEHGDVFQFMIGPDPAVVGFISRPSEGAAEAEPFDARELTNNGGTFSFDLKMTAAPVNGQTPWLVKIESGSGDSFVEVNLSTANEGHANPELDTWQTYTFNLTDLAQAGANTGLDLSNLDAIFIFPTWGEGEGAEFLIDNVKF